MTTATKGSGFDDMEDDFPFGNDDSAAGSDPSVELQPEEFRPTYEQVCKACGGSGRYYSYSGRNLGACFKCKGAGKLVFKTAPEQRQRAAASRLRARDRKEQTKAEQIAAFEAANPDLVQWWTGNDFEFAVSMREALHRWGTLTERQLAAAKNASSKFAEAKAKRAAEAAERVANAPAVGAALGKVEDAFASAIAKGIKSPKLRLGEFKLAPAKAHSNNAGAIYVTEQETGAYLGKVMGGKFLRVRDCTPEQEAKVLEVCADPEAAAVAYGRRTGSCSICGRELTNGESIDRGIGPICAEKFGW